MQERTTAQVVFPDGRVTSAIFPVWLLPLPGDWIAIPGEVGLDGGFLPLTVTARLLQPEPVTGQPQVTLFVDSAVEQAGRPRLAVVK
ncbi:hypothetical protein GN316_06555 [Xylophilus sp. Kf1]|nr:hypothetical protein [Xylophilus sp. Kf1]